MTNFKKGTTMKRKASKSWRGKKRARSKKRSEARVSESASEQKATLQLIISNTVKPVLQIEYALENVYV